VLSQGGNGAVGIAEPASMALGNLFLYPRIRLIGGEGKVFTLAFTPTIAIPTATDDYTGRKPYAFLPGLASSLAFERWGVALDLAAVLAGKAQIGAWEVSHALQFKAGAWFYVLPEKLALVGEAFGATSLTDFGKGDLTPVELLGGVKWHVGKGWTVNAGGGAGVTKGFTAPEYRFLAGVSYSCQPQAPRVDTDGDGLYDDEDDCPNEPEDADSFDDGDGCPDPDNDKDGVLDVADRCPLEPEDKDGYEDVDGCPDPDNDADAIKDVDDKCPNEPEVKNGVEDDDGCPDELAKVTKEQIVILDKVLFEFDKDVILQQSYGVLDAVVKVLKDHPEIKKIRIEGHTDTRGSAEHNQKLSQIRTEAVQKYLVDHGIQTSRLTSKGFGASRPLVTPEKGEDDYQKNRRVEFVIVEQDR